jgi:hypothetical protein
MKLFAIALAGLAVISVFMPLPFISDYAFWLLLAAFLIQMDWRKR